MAEDELAEDELAEDELDAVPCEPDCEADGCCGDGNEALGDLAEGCEGEEDRDELAERCDALEELDEEEDDELAELDDGVGMLGVCVWGRGEFVLQALRSERLRAQVATTVTTFMDFMVTPL